MIKCDAACTKHVSQSLVWRRHSMRVSVSTGDGGGDDDNIDDVVSKNTSGNDLKDF